MSSGSHLCLLLDLTNYGHYVTHFEASSLVFRKHCVLFGVVTMLMRWLSAMLLANTSKLG